MFVCAKPQLFRRQAGLCDTWVYVLWTVVWFCPDHLKGMADGARHARRDAIRTLTRLGRNLASPLRVDRDCGKETLEAFLAQLLSHLDSQLERTEAEEAIKKWNESAGVSLFVPQIPPLPLVGHDGGDPLPAARRVSCCDVMLTFNSDFVPRGTAVADWFQAGGKVLLQEFLVTRKYIIHPF